MIEDKVVHKTWLLDGLFHSAPGFIKIEKGCFSFSLVGLGTFSKSRLEKFQLYSNEDQFYKHLSEEGTVEVIKIDLKNIVAKFPWYNFMGGAVLTFGDFEQRMHLSFVQPQNTKFPYHRIDNELVQLMAVDESIDDLKKGRSFGKKLKETLEQKNSN